MKKFYILLFSFVLAILTYSTSQAQGTETFEAPLPINSTSWVNAGLTFTSSSTNFDTDEFVGAGAGGSDRYIDNIDAPALNSTYSINLTAGASLFTMQSMEIYVSSDPGGANPTDDGTMTFVGKDGGTTVYTATKTTGFPTTFGATNGFFLLDFTALPGFGDASGLNIDEIEITINGAFQYFAVDNFEFDNEVLEADPPEVQSIVVVGTPPSTSPSVDFLVTFNENANNVSTDDFSLDAVGTFGTIASVSSATGTAITVTVNGISGEGTISIDLNAGTNIADDLGNTPPPAFTAGATHAVSRCFQETFESFTVGDIMWSSNGVTYTSTTANFNVENFGSGGAGGSDQFLSNDADQGLNKVYSITTTGPELFNIEALDVYLSSEVNGANPTDDGDITLEGRLSGSTLYTIQKTTGFPTDFSVNNGFYVVDFATEGTSDYSLTNIDELRITIGGAFIYIALDNFEHCEEVTAAAPPIVQSIKLIGNPPANSASVDFEVIFNENAVNVTADDFSLDLLGTATGTINAVTGSGNTYNVDVNGISGEGSLRVDLNGGTDIEDESGNTPPDPFIDGERFIVSICDVETFEGLADGTFSWTTNTVPWASQGAAFSVDEFIGAGAGGSDRYMDNVTSQGTGDINTIAITDTQMVKMGSMEVYVSSVLNGDTPTDDGTLTVRGKLDGTTLYTVTKSTGFPTIFGSTQGFYLWDFATEGGTDWSTTDVDEIELELGGAFQYLAVDNFKFCMDPPDETEVALVAGTLTITDINGGVSDDDINLSIVGPNLRITNTIDRFQVSGAGVVEVDDNTVDVLLANITGDILIDGVSGNDLVTLDAVLNLTGGFTVENVSTFVQNQSITTGGLVFIDVNGPANLNLGTINSGGGLTVSAQGNITDDPAGILSISGATNLFSTLDLNINNVNVHSLGGTVAVDAEDIILRANSSGSPMDIVALTAQGGGASSEVIGDGDIIVTSDADGLLLNGFITAASPDGDLTLNSGGTGGILQTANTITADQFVVTPGGQTATMTLAGNDVNIFRAANGDTSFTDVDDVILFGVMNVNSLTVTGTDIEFANNADITLNGTGSNTFTGNITGVSGAIINQNNGDVSFVGGTVDLSNLQFNGAASTTTNIDGTLATAGSQLTFNNLMVNSGDYQTNGVTTTVNGVAMFGATANLIGTGSIDGEVVIDNGGELAAGNSPGCLSTGNLSLLGGSTATFEVQGVTPCTLHDQIQVTGTVTIDPAANIVFSVGYANAPADEIILILNDGTDPISGTFNGYPEGAAVSFGAFSGFITYAGGDGNDVSIAADTTPPVITCPADITVDNDPGVCGAVVTYTVTATDNNPGVTVVSTPPSGSTFPVGTTTVNATATDAAGNTASCSFTITVNDTEDPVITCPANITVSNDPGACGAVVSYTAPTATDNCTGATGPTMSLLPGSAYTLSALSGNWGWGVSNWNSGTPINNATELAAVETILSNGYVFIPSSSPTPPYNGIYSWPAPSSQMEFTSNSGIITFDAFSFMSTRSYSTSTTITVEYRTGGGAWNTAASVTAGSLGISTGTVNTYTIPFTEVTADQFRVTTSPDQISFHEVWINGSVATAATITQTDTTGLTSGDEFPVGTTTLEYTATDASGNTDVCTFTVTVNDDEDPVVTCPADITVSNDPGQCDAVVTFTPTATDNCPGVTVSSVPASGSVFPVGTTTVTVTATDASGNTDICTFDVTVNDDEDPVVTCPADITVSNDPGNCDAVVTFTPTATDNCPGVTISSVPASGSAFPVGTTTVTVTATDASGNTDVCTFDVTVNDDEDPVIICPADITVNNDPGICGAVVTYSNPVATDNCSTPTIAASGTPTIQLISSAGGTGNRSGVSYNPTLDKYYSFNAGNSGYPIDCFEGASGAFISNSPSSGLSYRGAWWNPITNQSEGNGIGATGIVSTTIVGNCPDGNFTSIQSANQPNAQSCGDFNYDANEIIYYDSGSVRRVDRSTGATLGTTTLTGTPGGSAYALYSIGYTGESGFEYAIYDATTQAVHLYNLSGAYQGSSTIGLTTTDFGFIYENGQAWIYNNNRWNGFIIFMAGPPTVTQTAGLPSGSTFPVGTTTNTFFVTDNSGNTATCSFEVTVTDNEPPIANCVAPFTIQLDANGDANITPADINNGSTDNCGIASLAVSPSTFTCADVGPNTVTLTVTDVNGNSSTCTTVVTVEDNVAPIAVCMDITIDLDADGNATITPADVDGGSTDACGIGSLSIDIDTFDCSNVGPNNVVLTVTDVNGNSSQCTAVVTVQDVTPPVMACPADIVTVAEPDICGIILTYADPLALDACGIDTVVLTSGLPSGSLFPVGVSTVVWTATDVNGNSSTCSFTVTVTDETPPVAVCQDITIPLDATGNATITVADVDGGSFDNCAIDTMTIDINTFDCSDVGPNDVTLTVTDIYGNVSSCIAVVTVEDVTAPVAVCQNITVQLDATGTVTINPADLDGGSTDVCGIDTAAYSVDIDTFDCSNVGDNPVVLTVTDVNGNTSTCTAIVTVEDITEPDLVCQDITVELDANGEASIIADDVIASNTDACGLFETSIDISEFNCDDIGAPVIVTVFSEDVNGNISTCTAEVTVVDLLAPVVTCPADQTVDPGGANDQYEVPDYLLTGEATAVDNCTDPLVITTQDPAPGTLLSEGTYTVTITAEDESGNIGTCTFELIVDSTLGANDTKFDISTIVMYPNPAQAIVNISNPQAIPLENATIYDVTGRLVKTFDLRNMGTEKALDIATLASATYVVVIQSENGTLTKQLIKE